MNPLSTGLHSLPTGLVGSSSPELNPNNKRHISGPSDYERPDKRNVIDVNNLDESHSIHAGDAQELLVNTKAKKHSESTGPSTSVDPEAFELLGGLVKALETSDDLGTNINDKLADLINKRWGQTLTPEKLKTILEKYRRPANSTALHPIKVNKGAWEHLNYNKKQEDLRLAGMQQVLRKVAYIMLHTTDFLLAEASTSQNREKVNKCVSVSGRNCPSRSPDWQYLVSYVKHHETPAMARVSDTLLFHHWNPIWPISFQ